jgi:hypothetical protein
VDSWESQHPAPVEARYAFVDSLIKDIQNFLLSSTIECSNDDSTNRADEISKKILYLKILATSEFEGFTTVESSNIPEECIYVLNIDQTLANIPPETREKMFMRFLPKFNDPTELLFHNVEDNQLIYRPPHSLFDFRLQQVMPRRKLFRTEENRSLGLGPQSLEIGDLVCVLAGGRALLDQTCQ